MNLEKVYWRFARRRLARYYARLGVKAKVEPDSILDKYRFTNVYRASDRVSQKLIEIQYSSDYVNTAKEVFFRTMLFKMFNKLETWELITSAIEPRSKNLPHIAKFLRDKDKLYSAAYIIPSPAGQGVKKADAHMSLLTELVEGKFYRYLSRALSLQEVYELLLTVRSFGPFIAYQYAIDLNYSEWLNFDEASFVVAGPGALDGVQKIFPGEDPLTVIHRMSRKAPEKMKGMSLFGRELQPIDCQNLFCEISKYTRIAYPDLVGTSGRTTIKQQYKPHADPMPRPFFPPKWGITL